MDILRFKKLVSSCVMLAFTSLTTLVPFAQARAAAVCDTSNWQTAQGSNAQCTTLKYNSGATYAFPKLDWREVASMPYTAKGGLQLSAMDRIAVDNNRSAAALGLSSDQVANVINLLPANVPMVFARFNPAGAELRIEIFKLERTGTQTTLRRAKFAPEHGRAWAASLAYETKSAQQQRLNPGRNPFALFEGGDDAFHNLAGMNAAQVAVGHAMQASGAAIGLVAVADIRVDQYTTKSGGLFKKTITQHVDGYTKPLWYVTTPRNFQPHAEMMSMCMDKVTNPTDCPATSLVSSNVSWTKWEGGSLPAFETLTSQWSKSQSGFTLLAWVAIAFVAFFTAGAILTALAPAVGAIGPATSIMAAAGPSTTFAAATVGEAALTTITYGALTDVAIAAGIEAGVAGAIGMVQGAGLTDVTGGPYLGAASGFGEATTGTSAAQTSVLNGIHSKFDTPEIQDSAVTAVSQGLYGQNCAPGATAASCASSGIVPRVDTFQQTDTIGVWEDNGAPVPSTSNLLN